MKPSHSEKQVLGWDIGGTKSSAVIGTSSGEILAKETWPSNADHGPEAMITDFLRRARPLRERFPAVSALGVSIGGPLDPRHGILYSPPHLPGWDAFPLKARMTETLGLKVAVEHDAAACLEAEVLWGSARGSSHAAYLTAGTGFGAGLLLDGRIVRGPSGQTTEVGHIRLAESGPRLYGKSGCVESFCSGTGLALLAREMFPAVFTRAVSPRELAQRAEEGCAASRAVLMKSAQWTGRVCAMLTDLFSLQVIIIGSLARYLPPWWLGAIRDEALREALPINAAHGRIVTAGLGDRLQDLSATAPCFFTDSGSC